MLTIPVTILSMVYMCLLAVAYFSKDRIATTENKIYSYMIGFSCLGITLDATSCILVLNHLVDTVFFRFVTLLMFVYYILWSGLFLMYVFTISMKKDKMNEQEFLKIYENRLKIILGIFIICAFMVPFMPLSYNVEDNAIFPEGLAVDFTYFVAGFLSMIIMLLLLLFNRKNARTKQYIPVYALIILFLLVVVIQKMNPSLILTTTVECFITFIMYFTIENPDVQLISELYKNRKIIEKTNEDVSKFLFRMTQDIKKPVKDIITLSHDIVNMKTKEEMIKASRYINNYSNQIDYLINKALNISNMDTQKIKVFDNKYNVHNLFKEVATRAREDMKENLKFDFNINENIPTYLYGDAIKIKQAVLSVINIANEFTSEGFISLDVSSMVRYNICRLVIMIEDSGRGIGIERINEILSYNSADLEKINTNNTKDGYLDIISVKKIANMLGGSFMIKSEENVGTTVTIVLEQKIVENAETEITKKLESYEQSLHNEKKVLIVDDDERELADIEKMLTKHDISVSSTVYERDCIEKIRSKLKYDLIILDDEIGEGSALNILKELQKIKDFKTPVVVMLNKNKDSITLQYLKDGFADCIKKEKLESEIERIIKLF